MERKKDVLTIKDYQYTLYHGVEDMRGNWRQIKENQKQIKTTHSQLPAVIIMKEDEFHAKPLKITSHETDKKLIYIEDKSFMFYYF